MTIKGWHCQERCGACCYLQPSERPDLADYLTPTELTQYLAMVGADGWCQHYDRATRHCTIYTNRPEFCRVTPAGFQRMYGINAEGFDEFAVNCCFEQISDIFGPKSPEFERYARSYDLSSYAEGEESEEAD
ncbi:MAG: YkgJ family cysteine cluster protein [Cyanobacteria bacterium J06641_5]